MMIFVFGSNLAGIHGAGAARTALKKHGAIYGIGVGIQGNSYGIPTKDENVQTMPLSAIKIHVKAFKAYASIHSDKQFQVTQIGCGLAGHVKEDIAPMFVGSPINCIFDEAWKPWFVDSGHSFFKF